MVSKTDVLFGVLVLTALFAMLHSAALEHALYWRYWWFDIVMHFLGGVIIAFLYAWFVQFHLSETYRKRFAKYIYVFLLAFIIGTFWEVFEYAVGFGQSIPFAEYVADTIIDLVMDVAGAGLAYAAFNHFKQ